MEKLTQLISKNIFSLSSGKKLGYILNVNFDENLKYLKSFLVADDESEMEATIDAKNLFFSGGQAFVRREDVLTYSLGGEANNPIGKLVFTDKGGDCGKVREVVLAGNKAQSVIADRICFSSREVSCVGADAIILGKKKKAAAPQALSRPSFISSQPESLVSITASISAPEIQPTTPYRISTDPKNLIGKMATKDIFGLNNELIIKKFEIITQKKLNEIKKHNKLNILFYNCK